MRKNIALYSISFLFLSLISLPSCDTFDAEAEVPAYVQIDSVKVITEIEEGTNHQKISDVWFNLDGSQVGVFEMPTRFPVIAKGKRPVSIRAGVLKSGIHDFREAYPFFETIRDTFNFVGTEIIPYTPIFKYKPETKFWIEDFEDPGIKLHTNDSTNYLTQIIDPKDANNHLGYVFIPDTVSAFQTYTKENIELSNTPIYMEIEYKCDYSFGIGIIMHHMGGSSESQQPFTIVKPTDEWNKLYLNIGEQFSVNPGAVSYDIYFFFAADYGTTSSNYIDNIKILSF